ncbi:MAG: HIT domain-containing protein [Ignavibacteria bacterium]|jgi:ATP adenylyltransferase|nr:HIT domain-containing protein [Ignavibacteria bacterium]
MDRIYSPWRSQYIESFNEEKKEECFLCGAIHSVNENKERLIIARESHCIVLLNKYPYNSGHTLVVPLHHISDLDDLTTDELVAVMATTKKVVSAMKDAFHPHGFNIGINIGQSAGAGLPGHLHFHIVPRWNGDANFTATISDMKVISTAMENTRLALIEKMNDSHL